MGFNVGILINQFWILNLCILFIIAPFLRVTKTPVGDLLPFQDSDEPCNEQGGCFVAGDTRVNKNTALEGYAYSMGSTS